MRKVVIFGALTALLFLFAPATQAQDADEVAKLRRENEQLKKENDLLKKQIEQLKKEAKARLDGVGGPKIGAKDLEPLQGTWNIDSQQWGGNSLPKELMKGYKFVFAGDKLTWEGALGMMTRMGKITALDGAFPCDFKIDAGKKPKQIDITLHLKKGDRTILGIYEIKGDTLKLCHFTSNTGQRPVDFSNDNRSVGLIILTRAKK